MLSPIDFKFAGWITRGQGKVPFKNWHQVMPPGGTILKRFPCDNSRTLSPIDFKFDGWITRGQGKVPFENRHQVVPPGGAI